MRWVAVLVVSLLGIALGVTGLLSAGTTARTNRSPISPRRCPRSWKSSRTEIATCSFARRSPTSGLDRSSSRVSDQQGGADDGRTAARPPHRRLGTVKPDVGELRYVESGSQGRWQLLRFALYELRRAADGTPVAPGRPIALCLGDHSRTSRASERPVWTDGAADQPGLSMREGSLRATPSAATWLGSFVDVTNLPAGRYVLVQRTNRPRRRRERLCEQRGIRPDPGAARR